MIKLKEHAIRDNWSFALSISNPWDDDPWDDKCCLLHIAFFKHSYWFKIPQLFKPKEKWVDLSHYDWATERDGKKGYTDYIRRDYGFSVDKEALHIKYGIQPMSWSRDDPENSDHSKCYFIPWNQTRRVRYDIFDCDGNYHMSVNDKPNGAIDFDAIHKARETVKKSKFKFNDFDGEEIIVTCYIEEMVWKYGTGLFKWVGWIRKPIIRRTLDLDFNKEIGYEKGSWKGGTTGHSVEIAVGESALSALQRYGSDVDSYKHHGRKPRGFSNIMEIQE